MKSGEFTGGSIDEAVFHGLQELGLSIDEVTIETLNSEKKGLFGLGAKLARVRLTERTEEDIEAAIQARNSAPEPSDTCSYTKPQPSRPKSASAPANRAQKPVQKSAPAPEYPYSESLAKEHPAGIFLKELLDKMNITAKVLLCETDECVRIRIDSDTRGLLIGRRGETLDALQYLVSLHINRTRKHDKFLRVALDTEDYRARREDTLTRLARRQAARVKSTGRSISMEPMNPYERRVLHASLQNNPYVSTYSEGDEPNRRVVITPKRG